MGKQQLELRKAERTRQAILDTALEFLWSHSFRELNIKILMEHAGFSRATFYLYFDDIHGLIRALLADLEFELQSLADSLWFDAPVDPRAEMAEMLETTFRLLYARGPVVRATIEAAPMDEELSAAWNALMSWCDDIVAAAIRRDQSVGLIPAFDAVGVAQALDRMNIGYALHHFGMRPRTQMNKVLPAIIQIWDSTLYGAANSQPEGGE